MDQVDNPDVIVASGDPLIACDENSRITGWNEAAARITGLPAEAALGRPCWQALGGVDEAGAAICRAGCGYGRRARAGCPAAAHDSLIRTREGRRRVRMSTISLGGGERNPYLILIQPGETDPSEAPAPADEPERGRRRERLTARQRQVLGLLAEGVPARTVAQRLQLRESTVRNYIRHILIELHCHSQLEAVAVARRLGLI